MFLSSVLLGRFDSSHLYETHLHISCSTITESIIEMGNKGEVDVNHFNPMIHLTGASGASDLCV